MAAASAASTKWRPRKRVPPSTRIFTARLISRTSAACSAGSPHASTSPPLVAGPAAPVGDDAARRLDQRDQRLDVVGLQARSRSRCRRAPSRAACSSSSRRRSARGARRGGDRVRALLARRLAKWRGSVVATIGVGDRSAQARVASVAPRAAAPPLRAAARDADERLAHERLVRDARRPAACRRAARSASPSAAGRVMKLRVPSIGSMHPRARARRPPCGRAPRRGCRAPDRRPRCARG